MYDVPMISSGLFAELQRTHWQLLVYVGLMVAFSAGVLLAVLLVVSLFRGTWRFTRDLPSWQAAGIRSLLIVLIFTPGAFGGLAFLLPCPALLSFVLVLLIPEMNELGWVCGAAPMAFAWPVLWLLMYNRERRRRRKLPRASEQVQAAPVPKTIPVVAETESAVSRESARALKINEAWFFGGLVFAVTGFLLFLVLMLRSPVFVLIGGAMFTAGGISAGISRHVRPFIEPFGLVAERTGSMLIVNRFLGIPSLACHHRGVEFRFAGVRLDDRATYAKQSLRLPWGDPAFSFRFSVGSPRSVTQLSSRVSTDHIPFYSDAPRTTDPVRLQRLLASDSVVEALQRLAGVKDEKLYSGFEISASKKGLRISKYGATTDVETIEQFLAIATATHDALVGHAGAGDRR